MLHHTHPFLKMLPSPFYHSLSFPTLPYPTSSSLPYLALPQPGASRALRAFLDTTNAIDHFLPYPTPHLIPYPTLPYSTVTYLYQALAVHCVLFLTQPMLSIISSTYEWVYGVLWYVTSHITPCFSEYSEGWIQFCEDKLIWIRLSMLCITNNATN